MAKGKKQSESSDEELGKVLIFIQILLLFGLNSGL